MAARRLLALLLALLAVSTLAAALTAPAPDREPEDTRDTSASHSGARKDGRVIEATLNASARRPERIAAHRGDQLALSVRSPTGGQVEVPAFGRLEDVALAAPARFDLLLERAGRFEVRMTGSGRVIGTIAVRPAGRGHRGSEPRPGRP
jgi:hypothetical protein